MKRELEHNEALYQAVSRNIFLNAQFFEILEVFSKQNIAVIPLKGIALLQNVYRDISQRYLGDIDLLVRAQDVLRAATILESLGYTHPKINFNPQRPYSIYLNSLAFNPFHLRGGRQGDPEVNYSIHLHWHLLNTTLPFFMYRLNMNDIWLDARKERSGDREMLMMAPEHLLLYLSLHAFHHSFENLTLLWDIKKVVEFYKNQLDWQATLDFSRKWNVGMAFYLSLYFTSIVLGLDIPQDLINSVKPKKISRNGQKAISLILKNRKGWHNLAYPLFLDMAETVWDKAKFVFLTFFPPAAELSKVHPHNWGFVIFWLYLKKCDWGITQIIRFLKNTM